MNIEYTYQYFDLTNLSEICNDLINLAKTKNKSSRSLMSNYKKENISKNVIRNFMIAWI